MQDRRQIWCVVISRSAGITYAHERASCPLGAAELVLARCPGAKLLRVRPAAVRTYHGEGHLGADGLTFKSR